MIENHWETSEGKPGFISPREKSYVRECLLKSLEDPHRRVRVAAVSVVVRMDVVGEITATGLSQGLAAAAVAEVDFPQEWEELVPRLIGLLNPSAPPSSQHGAVTCLKFAGERIATDGMCVFVEKTAPPLLDMALDESRPLR